MAKSRYLFSEKSSITNVWLESTHASLGHFEALLKLTPSKNAILHLVYACVILGAKWCVLGVNIIHDARCTIKIRQGWI